MTNFASDEPSGNCGTCGEPIRPDRLTGTTCACARAMSSVKPRFRKWVVHVMANCKQCDWTTQDHQNGQAEASRHARLTGHEIEGEIGYAFRYEK